MNPTKMMSVMPAIHKTMQQPAEQANLTEEMEPFSVKLNQMLLQATEQVNSQTIEQKAKSEAAALETDLGKLLDSEQEETRVDSEEEEVHSEAAALFQQPLAEMETELKLFGQAEESSKNEEPTIVQPQMTHLEAEAMEAVKMILPEKTQANTSSFAKEIQSRASQMETVQKVTKTETPVEETTRKLIGIEEQAKPIVQPKEAAQSLFEAAVQPKSEAKDIQMQPMEPLVNGAEVEFQYTGEQDTLPVVETKIIEMSDLDIQSDFRMKVSLPKLEEIRVEMPAIQQPITTMEQPITVTLVDKNPAVNQQQLAQSVSDVMMQQMETTQNGQTTTARLSLKPEALGQVTIELRMEDNQLKTVISVESVEVKEMLDKGMQQLTTSLAQKNIQLNETTIQLNQPQESNFAFAENSSHQEQQQENSQSIVQTDRQEEIVSQPAEEADTTIGRVSILA